MSVFYRLFSVSGRVSMRRRVVSWFRWRWRPSGPGWPADGAPSKSAISSCFRRDPSHVCFGVILLAARRVDASRLWRQLLIVAAPVTAVTQSVSQSVSLRRPVSQLCKQCIVVDRSLDSSVGRSLYDAYEKTRCDGGGGGVTVAWPFRRQLDTVVPALASASLL